MTRYKNFTRSLGIIFLMSIGQGVYSQPTDVPQLSREAQEVVSAAAETIRQNKLTIDSRSMRIQQLKEQLESAQVALDLAIENNDLCTEVRQNQLAEIRFLKTQYLDMKQEMKKERRRKIFWKCATIVTSATTLYFFVF